MLDVFPFYFIICFVFIFLLSSLILKCLYFTLPANPLATLSGFQPLPTSFPLDYIIFLTRFLFDKGKNGRFTGLFINLCFRAFTFEDVLMFAI